MKHNTIKWRIFKYNTLIIVMLVILTTIMFNRAVRIYFEKDIRSQLNKIADSTVNTALLHGPDFLSEPKPLENKLVPPNKLKPKLKNKLKPKLRRPEDKAMTKLKNKAKHGQEKGDIYRYYFMLDRNLKESLTLLNSDFILLDKKKKIITPFSQGANKTSKEMLFKIIKATNQMKLKKREEFIDINVSNSQYIAIIKPVYDKNSFGLGWIIIYSSLQKVNELQKTIILILFIILLVSSVVIGLFSSHISKKISTPFIYLNKYIKDISARNFGDKLHITVDDEFKEFVHNINIMSEKLETYDKAQKTFLQNASHEFRTPLMSIQSYAEGIKYNIVDSDTAVEVILDETKRMTHLVEDLLYLSRLDAIEENYEFELIGLKELLLDCSERMERIAQENNIKIYNQTDNDIVICADEEKLGRAIINIIGNCIRYANTSIIVSLKIRNEIAEIVISDDGDGFEDSEINNVFDRFYKGRKGNSGLGLSISKNVIEKHNGRITAANSQKGAVFTIELPIKVRQ